MPEQIKEWLRQDNGLSGIVLIMPIRNLSTGKSDEFLEVQKLLMLSDKNASNSFARDWWMATSNKMILKA